MIRPIEAANVNAYVGNTRGHERILTTNATDYADFSHLSASQIRVIRCIRVIRGKLFSDLLAPRSIVFSEQSLMHLRCTRAHENRTVARASCPRTDLRGRAGARAGSPRGSPRYLSTIFGAEIATSQNPEHLRAYSLQVI